jgi:hypothetical protein
MKLGLMRTAKALRSICRLQQEAIPVFQFVPKLIGRKKYGEDRGEPHQGPGKI